MLWEKEQWEQRKLHGACLSEIYKGVKIEKDWTLRLRILRNGLCRRRCRIEMRSVSHQADPHWKEIDPEQLLDTVQRKTAVRNSPISTETEHRIRWWDCLDIRKSKKLFREKETISKKNQKKGEWRKMIRVTDDDVVVTVKLRFSEIWDLRF